MFPTANKDALDLLMKLLQFNPTKRITIEDALNHPFLSDVKNAEDESSCEDKVNFEITEEMKNEIRAYKEKIVYDIKMNDKLKTRANTRK